MDKFLIHNFMNLIQSYDIPLSSICLTSPVAFPFRFLCELLLVIFNDRWCRQHVFYIQITGIGIYIYCQTPNSAFKLKFWEQTSAKRYHPFERDKLCAKGLPFLIFTISRPSLAWVSNVCL